MTTVSPLAPADRILLEQVLRDTGVERFPGRPGAADYILAVARALAERMGHTLEPLTGLLGPHASQFLIATKMFLIVILGLLLFVVIRWFLLRRTHRQHGPERGAVESSVDRSDGEERPLGLEAWASEMELHLEAGDARGALKALWWWLARSLCGPRADPSWTSRELLDRAQRPDLRPFATAFDRLAYGPETPCVPDVRDLVSRLRSVLA